MIGCLQDFQYHKRNIYHIAISFNDILIQEGTSVKSANKVVKQVVGNINV